MAEIHLADAAETLANHFGARLQAYRDDGRRQMAAVLHNRFGISTREAQQLLDGMEQAGTIRWIEPHINTVRPIIPPGDIGYWQLEPE